MFQSYEQIFSQRADAYQKAMELYPTARDREFRLAVESARVEVGDVVCDAPSGGGYLRAYLPEGVQCYLAVETAPDFTGHCELGENDRIVRSPLTCLDLDDNSVDVCINLAGSHHLEDKTAFFREAARVLKAGGRLVLADVQAGSATDTFLNRFVHENNSMGHEGLFLDTGTARDLASCGFNIESDRLVTLPWSFEDRGHMAVFCKLLFGMDLASAESVARGIEDILGCIPGPGKVNLAWPLRYIAAVKS